MADNITLNAGSAGDTLAADDVGGAKHQRVKLEWGADGTINETDTASGKALPVQGEAADDSAATGNPVAIGAVMDDTTPNVVDEGDVGFLRMSTRREAYIQLRDAAGNERGLNVDASGRVTEANSAAILADTASMDTNLATVAGAVSGTEMQADVTSISAGSNLIGDVGLSGARTSGGSTMYRNIDVDETEDAIKASAGQIYWIHCVTIDATPVYLHFYDATVASVTVGTTTPDLTFLVPSQGDANGAGFAFSVPNGIAFSTAITVSATTTVGGSAGPGTNEVILNVGYA